MTDGYLRQVPKYRGGKEGEDVSQNYEMSNNNEEEKGDSKGGGTSPNGFGWYLAI